MKTRKAKTLLVVAGMAILAFAACEKKKTNPTPPSSTGGSTTGQPNQGEVITDFELRLSSMSGTNVVTTTYKYIDPDGEGGQPATFGGTNQSDSVIALAPGKTYTANIWLFDKTKNPVDTVSKEVEEEGAEHMFFFNQTNPTVNASVWTTTITGSGVTIRYNDSDGASTPRPIGLETIWQTTTSTLTNKYPAKITLRHQPNAKDGTFAPGETDVEVPFKLRVL
ncbi:MAG: hypothetical protein QM534_16030 [Sediminibacterium sp.]|nr:hypothetical protein [Sediminibacterium sp.]